MMPPDRMAEVVEAAERALPNPEDGSARVLTKLVLVAEFSDSDGARQIAFAGHQTTPWDIYGLLTYVIEQRRTWREPQGGDDA